MKLREADAIYSPDAPCARIRQIIENGALAVYLSSAEPVSYVVLKWNFSQEERFCENVKVLGDAWERSYGDLQWLPVDEKRALPWLCAVSNGSDSDCDASGRVTRCFGVKTRPAAFCLWQVSDDGVTLTADVRSGGSGVELGVRELKVCEAVFAEYAGVSAFAAMRQFYRLLNDAVLPVPGTVYGSNNWYYAYGKSSAREILADTALIRGLTAANGVAPYMVIDDGWQKNATDGPWHTGNERFGDMAALASEIASAGVKPGLWVRYLADAHRETPNIMDEMRLMRDPNCLDPSHPAVLEKIAEDTRRFTLEWGYRLIKHDYTTCDIFGCWGFQRPGFMALDGWSFFDRSLTSAEVIIKLYKTILDSAPKDTVILGCNVIGHLAAGLVHLNRTGDDTSGREWERTVKMGVNTLAFRLPQHKALFDVDADCVGITGQIPWELNRRWLKLLSKSGTPLFVSCAPKECRGEVKSDLEKAFLSGAAQTDELIPLDWMERIRPEEWLLNGERIHISWTKE
ncbi:MAG: hypothetical protein II920_07455 [Clostridia bacterium]|nr:hypothetical protein [Clostridia bacterium]